MAARPKLAAKFPTWMGSPPDNAEPGMASEMATCWNS